ncbi:hypothetical protein [Calothrix sp. 336/3]|uniref:hypothetical protein n=1 Tax=Calothrix sp. 336/3 TaxID=1337936 RepID=UPI0004E29A6A|nr:hypothetical protein [Calothrix sp. 336/3]AKG22745.1 plasmid segregation centromere-binding protein ParR [Calothrix sp. 336/3]
MFQWSKKVVKSVTFNPGVADESLLALIESYLEKDPNKTFSDLCKEALWQALCVPESTRPIPKQTAVSGGEEQQVADLQSQLTDLDRRSAARDSHRLEQVEYHLMQLSQQVAQLALMVNQPHNNQPVVVNTPRLEVVNHAHSSTVHDTFPQDVDPVISRLSQFLDDF